VNNKIVFFLLSLFVCFQTDCFNYMNDQDVSLRTVLTGDYVMSIYYNILNQGDGTLGGVRRWFGIHNMSVTVDGYEAIDLIKDDVCMYPRLFTLLSNILSDENVLVQRWSCVKWALPLSFGFKVENDKLIIVSSIWKYRFLSLFRAKETILLTKKIETKQLADKDLLCTVSINGRSAIVAQKTVLQVINSMQEHSTSSK